MISWLQIISRYDGEQLHADLSSHDSNSDASSESGSVCSSAAGEALLNETLVRAGQLRDALKNGYSKLTAGLPCGWRAAVDESSGDTYYYHSETGKTQWEVPALLPNSDGAATWSPNGDDADEDDLLCVSGSAEGGRAEGVGRRWRRGRQERGRRGDGERFILKTPST